MKLPFDFANKLLLRLVLPGALLAALFWPVLLALRVGLDLEAPDAVLAPVCVIAFGWLMLFVDMPVYMLAQGRRFWPAWLKRRAVAAEAGRLTRLTQARREAGEDMAREYDLEIRQFPLTSQGEPTARHPTRLGNLISASETYPDRKYGIDGAFGWYRLWVVIDKDLRAELDDQQALVDSALYGAAIAGLSTIVCLIYALVRLTTGQALIYALPAAPILIVLSAASAGASALLYRACLTAQAHYGELFAALFDQHVDRFGFKTILGELEARLPDAGLANASNQERARAAVRFLRWHKYRPAGETKNRTVGDW